jgi:hypothetical protein
MSHLSQNLEKLIQMISIEQLLGLVKQNSSNNKTNTDVLSLPIVQKVVSAYEEEINILNTRMNTNFNSHSPSLSTCDVKDYSEDIAKIHDQLGAINNSLLQLSEAIKSISFNPATTAATTTAAATTAATTTAATTTATSNNEENIQLKIEEIKSVNLEVEVEDSDDESELSDLEEEEEEVSVEEAEEVDEESSEVDESHVYRKRRISEAEVSEAEVSEAEVVSETDESDVEISDDEEESANETNVTEIKAVNKEQKEEADSVVNLEEEEEVFEIEIDDVTYYATSEENGILYAVDKDGEVGKQVGVIKDGEPIFS